MKKAMMSIVITSALGSSVPAILQLPTYAQTQAATNVKETEIIQNVTGQEAQDTEDTGEVKVAVNSYISPRWINKESFIFTHETTDGEKDYVYNIRTNRTEPLLGENVKVSDAVASPDGKKVAYITENNEIYVADLETKQPTKISGDDSAIKSELLWSANGDKLYYLEGDKTNVISEINIASGKIKKIVNDNVNYKSNLRLSSDGVKLLYMVSPEGKITAESLTEENADKAAEAKVAVDTRGTEPQLYVYYFGSSKPQQITKTADNKAFADMLWDRSVVYLSVSSEESDKPPVLKQITNNGTKTKDLISDMNILQSTTTANGKLFVLAASEDGKKAVYEISASTGEKKKLYNVDENVNQLYFSPDGSHLAVSISGDKGEKIGVRSFGEFIEVKN
jgi:Tol biopolymer transport system component